MGPLQQHGRERRGAMVWGARATECGRDVKVPRDSAHGAGVVYEGGAGEVPKCGGLSNCFHPLVCLCNLGLKSQIYIYKYFLVTCILFRNCH